MVTKISLGCSRRTASRSCMTICSTPYESVLCKYSIYRVLHMVSRRTGSWRRQVAQQAFNLMAAGSNPAEPAMFPGRKSVGVILLE